MDLDAEPIVITIETWYTESTRYGERKWASWSCSHAEHKDWPTSLPVRAYKVRKEINSHLSTHHLHDDVETVTRPRETSVEAGPCGCVGFSCEHDDSPEWTL